MLNRHGIGDEITTSLNGRIGGDDMHPKYITVLRIQTPRASAGGAASGTAGASGDVFTNIEAE
jgi:hypothetical protein